MRDVLGGCPPVDCRKVRRCNPTRKLYSPTLPGKEISLVLSKIRRVYRSITPNVKQLFNDGGTELEDRSHHRAELGKRAADTCDARTPPVLNKYSSVELAG